MVLSGRHNHQEKWSLTGHYYLWRNGRAVECGGLENRCSASAEPGVRIPLSPQTKSLHPPTGGWSFYFQRDEPGLPEWGPLKIKIPDEQSESGSDLVCRVLPHGITESNPSFSAYTMCKLLQIHPELRLASRGSFFIIPEAGLKYLLTKFISLNTV